MDNGENHEVEPLFNEFLEENEIELEEEYWNEKLSILRSELQELGVDLSNVSDEKLVKAIINILKVFLDAGFINDLMYRAFNREEGDET